MRGRTLGVAVGILVFSLLAIGGVAAQDTTSVLSGESAELIVDQPSYVSSEVETTSQNGTTVYTVRGSEFVLEPENFNVSNVTDTGVRESEGQLTFDARAGRYTLDVGETAGTYTVYWHVRENGSRAVYEAIIDVEQADYAHLSAAEVEELRDEADFGQWVIDRFAEAGLVASDAAIEDVQPVVDDAATWYKFYDCWHCALSGQFVTLGIMIVSWPAGWILIEVLTLLYFLRDYRRDKQLRKYRRQLADIEDLDEAEREAYERELKRLLSQQTFQDCGLSDTDAQAIREHTGADNPRQFLDWFRSHFSERDILGTLLAAHEQLGHEIRVRRDEVGDVVDATLHSERLTGEDSLGDEAVADGGVDIDGSGQTVQYIAPTAALGDDEGSVLYDLDWTSIDTSVLWNSDVDAGELTLPVHNEAGAEGEDLISQAGIPVGEDGDAYHIVERREEFVDILIDIMEHIAASEYCDEEGRPEVEADIVDFMFTFTSVGSEKYRLPLWNVRDVLLRCKQRLDANERMQDLTEASEANDL